MDWKLLSKAALGSLLGLVTFVAFVYGIYLLVEIHPLYGIIALVVALFSMWTFSLYDFLKSNK